jgi:AcrR family transcriptional regulator
LTAGSGRKKEMSREKRERLLKAAGEIFAEHGFKGTTIKNISEHANTNIASVNYHFRDKETLYREVLHYAIEQCRHRYLLSDENVKETPVQRVNLELHRYAKAMFQDEMTRWQAKLFFREFIKPTVGIAELIREAHEPHLKAIEALIKDAIGSDAHHKEVRFSTYSAIFLCYCFFILKMDVMGVKADDRLEAGPREIADLISQFAIGGMQALIRL